MNAGRILALDVKRSISGLYLIGNEGVHLIAWKRQQTNLTRNMTMSGVNILRRSSSTNLHHKPRSSPPPHRVFPTHQDALWLKQSTPIREPFAVSSTEQKREGPRLWARNSLALRPW